MAVFLSILISVVLVLAVAFFVFRRAMKVFWWLLGGVVLVLIILAISGSVFDEFSLPFGLPPLMEELFGIFGRIMGDLIEVVTYPFRN